MWPLLSLTAFLEPEARVELSAGWGPVFPPTRDAAVGFTRVLPLPRHPVHPCLDVRSSIIHEHWLSDGGNSQHKFHFCHSIVARCMFVGCVRIFNNMPSREQFKKRVFVCVRIVMHECMLVCVLCVCVCISVIIISLFVMYCLSSFFSLFSAVTVIVKCSVHFISGIPMLCISFYYYHRSFLFSLFCLWFWVINFNAICNSFFLCNVDSE